MNNVKIKQLICERLLTMDDSHLIEIERVNVTVDRSKLWCRLTIQHGINQTVGMADKPCVRELGAVVVQIFEPKNAGSSIALEQMADKIGSHLQHYRVDKLELLTATTVIGNDPDFYQMNVRIPFRYN